MLKYTFQLGYFANYISSFWYKKAYLTTAAKGLLTATIIMMFIWVYSVLRFVLFLRQQMRHRLFWNLRLISQRSISSLHRIAYKGDILTVPKLMACIQISHACHLRADHLISCLIQLHQGQDCQHLPMMIIFTCHHRLVPQCHIIEGTRKLCLEIHAWVCLIIFMCVCVRVFFASSISSHAMWLKNFYAAYSIVIRWKKQHN